MNLPEQRLPDLLSWRRRGGLAAVAIGGSSAYALSFWLASDNDKVAGLARLVGIAAAVSWLAFGLVLLLGTRCRPSILHWADACLIAMGAGMVVKTLTMILNLFCYVKRAGSGAITTKSFQVHVAILALANLVMAAIFIRRAQKLGLSIIQAAGLWFIVLNGLFVLLFQWLYRSGGFAL